MNRIYIADLNAYNDGCLRGQWVELPINQEELQEIIDDLTNNGQTDYAIHDWELPFEISEYDNPFKLNEFFGKIERCGIDLEEIEKEIENYKFENALNLIRSIDFDFNDGTYIVDYLDYYEAEEFVKRELNERGLTAIKFIIGDCNFINDEIFKIDGYGNLKRVTKDDMISLFDEVIRAAYDSLN